MTSYHTVSYHFTITSSPIVGLPVVAGGNPLELSLTGTITGVMVDVCNFFMYDTLNALVKEHSMWET